MLAKKSTVIYLDEMYERRPPRRAPVASPCRFVTGRGEAQEAQDDEGAHYYGERTLDLTAGQFVAAVVLGLGGALALVWAVMG